MKLSHKTMLGLLVLTIPISRLIAQEETAGSELEQVLTQDGYDKTSSAIVKMVSDGGRKIVTGAILAVHKDNVGFILTSYTMVAGRDKVAVILKDYPDALLGQVVEKWIDFDLDLAIVAIKNFPPGQPVVTIGDSKVAEIGKVYTIIAHTEASDWLPVPTELTIADERHLIFGVSESSGLEGAPLLTEDGNMIGLIASDETGTEENIDLSSAVKSNVIKPIIKEWFQQVELQQKWREKGAGVAGWIWAVGGGVLGGTIATAIAIAGGGEETAGGLARPPEPPPIPPSGQ